MSAFFQNIVDMRVDYALWIAIVKKGVLEDGRRQIVARNQMNKDGGIDK